MTYERPAPPPPCKDPRRTLALAMYSSVSLVSRWPHVHIGSFGFSMHFISTAVSCAFNSPLGIGPERNSLAVIRRYRTDSSNVSSSTMRRLGNVSSKCCCLHLCVHHRSSVVNRTCAINLRLITKIHAASLRPCGTYAVKQD